MQKKEGVRSNSTHKRPTNKSEEDEVPQTLALEMRDFNLHVSKDFEEGKRR